MASSSTEVHQDQPVGHIVRSNPETAAVFDRYGIDYCCNGSRSLLVAATRESVSLETLTEELENASVDDNDPVEWDSLTELIDHIESSHHAYLRNELPPLLQLVTKVRIVHASSHPALADVYRTAVELADGMIRHIREEETVVFPIIRHLEQGEPIPDAELSRLREEISNMEQDHEETGDALARLAALTDGYRVPDGACTSYESMLARLERLQQDTYQHVHTENNILFRDAEALLQKIDCD